MSKILLTGANGFLGKSLINELSIDDTHFFCLSRSSGHYMINLEEKVPVFKENFDLIIHAAGKAHCIPKTEEEKKQFYDINVIGTRHLLIALEKTNLPKQFVFISSVSVYGQEFGQAIKEDFPLLASDPYGKSKIEAEEIVKDWCLVNNIICTILRLPLLVGKNPPGNLGSMVKAITKGYYFNIDGGKSRKSMVLAKDVATFIPKVATVGGTYNLTDGIHPNFNQLSFAIAKQKNKKRPFNLSLVIAKLLGYAGDLLGNKAPINSSKIQKITSELTFDDSKAREVLGWNPQSVLEYIKKNSI